MKKILVLLFASLLLCEITVASEAGVIRSKEEAREFTEKYLREYVKLANFIGFPKCPMEPSLLDEVFFADTEKLQAILNDQDLHYYMPKTPTLHNLLECFLATRNEMRTTNKYLRYFFSINEKGVNDDFSIFSLFTSTNEKREKTFFVYKFLVDILGEDELVDIFIVFALEGGISSSPALPDSPIELPKGLSVIYYRYNQSVTYIFKPGKIDVPTLFNPNPEITDDEIRRSLNISSE